MCLHYVQTGSFLHFIYAKLKQLEKFQEFHNTAIPLSGQSLCQLAALLESR